MKILTVKRHGNSLVRRETMRVFACCFWPISEEPLAGGDSKRRAEKKNGRRVYYRVI